MKRPRSTIADVARLAAVSEATVSRALSGARYVRQATRERVLAAAASLAYHPSIAAQSLTTGRSLIIGIIVSDIGIPFFTTVARSIQNVALQHGYLALIGNSDEESAGEDELLQALIARNVDGLIVTPVAGENLRLREVAGQVPLVLVDRLVDGITADAVLSDNFSGARAATQHLLSFGHTRIAYVTDEPNKTSSKERLAGFEAAMIEAGFSGGEELICVVDYHSDLAERGVRNLLRRHRPTALVASEGSITLGALRAISSLGLAVPSDISIVGFDQLDWGTATAPPISVVSQDTEQIGITAARLLLAQISRPSSAGEQSMTVRVPTKLVDRESCGPVAGTASLGRPDHD